MKVMNLDEISVVSGGFSYSDFKAIAELAAFAYQTVAGGVQGARNLAAFTSNDAVLTAVNGGNLGA